MTDYIEFSMDERHFWNEEVRREAMVMVVGCGRAPQPGRWRFVRATIPGRIRILWVRK